MTCTSCHGMPPTGHVAVSGAPAASSCAACHPNAVNPDGTINLAAGGHLNGRPDTSAVGCTACHGDAARTGNLPGTDVNLISSPPVAPASAPAYATGAHLGHVNPTAGSALMQPIACGACHVVPGDAQHAFRPPANGVVFSGIALTGGAAAAWNAGTAGCSASYCHGNFNYNGVTGTNATVLWTSTTPLGCTACHGMPPTGHVAVPGAPAPSSCNPCHSQSVSAAGVVNLTYHLNGKAEGGDCGSCHGLPPATNRHTESDHRRASCDACHPTGYNSSTIVAQFHNNGRVDMGAQAGYSCGLTGCPTTTNGTCTNSCHGANKGAWNSR
jgi:predicted CxxxxCH...CXXCH cytochrome family protein